MTEICRATTRKGTNCTRKAMVDGVCIQHSRSKVRCVECGARVLQKDAMITAMITMIDRCVASYSCPECWPRQTSA